MKRVQTYKKPKDFLYIVQRIIVSCFFLPENMKNVRETFLALNKSKKGEISREEYSENFENVTRDGHTIKWSDF